MNFMYKWYFWTIVALPGLLQSKPAFGRWFLGSKAQQEKEKAAEQNAEQAEVQGGLLTVHMTTKNVEYDDSSPYLGVSENGGFSPQIIHFNRVFFTIHVGVPLFSKTPIWVQVCQSQVMSSLPNSCKAFDMEASWSERNQTLRSIFAFLNGLDTFISVALQGNQQLASPTRANVIFPKPFVSGHLFLPKISCHA